jgi:hypothetical protein
VKTENLSRIKKGKRIYLDNIQTKELMNHLDNFFESYVEVPRIQVGKQQTIETLINEESLLFAKYLRNEKKSWFPRVLVIK